MDIAATTAPERAELTSRRRSAAQLSDVLDEIELTTVEDPDRAFDLAVDVLGEAAALGENQLRLRAVLVKADVQGRRGDTMAAARTLQEVNRWATAHQDRHLMARSHRLLSWLIFGVIGDDAGYLEHALRAVELLDDTMRPRMHAEHLTGLAIVQGRTGASEAGRQNLARAEEIVIRGGHVQLLGRIINNLAYLEFQAGAHDRAVIASERLLEVLQEHGLEMLQQYVDTVARAYLEVGRYGDAERILHGFLGDETADLGRLTVGDPEGGAELLLTLAEVQRRRGDHAIAAGTLQRCLSICERRNLGGILVRVRLERARLYAATEQFREAYTEMTAYARESQQLNADARSRMLKTFFEAEEARRTSERYQEMAHRDPLTGLHNRRHVDRRLSELLVPVAAGGMLSVAFIDLDRFKRINDSLSHEVGDDVLRQIAAMLSTVSEGHGFAARMGGEEFLLVLPGTDEQAAWAVCTRLQDRIRRHDWSAITGNLPVRASVGLTTAAVDGVTTQAALLADADGRLYRAKSEGRDRIVAGTLASPAVAR